ncbi:hypothetical protein [uncultured Tateyamaria sp.]|uniref:hypothetical protein n=1 Tax=Tateyamaria sp. 1078 TaxID=3417464 RepID=UPI002616227F|nr:hypothetical protein [uncultured Tateyamaria sp.]
MTRLLALIAALCMTALTAHAQERYEGYYYPPVTSQEQFSRVIRQGPTSNKGVRVEFVTNLTAAQLAAAESPRFVFFAKGADAKHLNIIALDDDVFSTIFRARAVMAQMTSNMRNNDFFRAQGLEYVATFYDLLQIMEFDTLVISDGESWAHQVNFFRE